jgi:glycerol-3-phosphate dehydrogenase
MLNAIDAAERGATILTRTELKEARRDERTWTARLSGQGGERVVRARALVNAGGPWVAELFDRIRGVQRHRSIRLVKGSHIVLPRLYPGDHAFILQNTDGRAVFAIPFETDFTLVGTTDVAWTKRLGQPEISDEEIGYLLEIVGRTFAASATRGDIVWTYSGVRGLVDDGNPNASRATRDYELELDRPGAPLLSVFGGKLTTYRSLAERALELLVPFFPSAGGSWTQNSVLPGGDIPGLDLSRFAHGLERRYRQLPTDLLHRLTNTYGTRTETLLEGAETIADLGEDFGAGLHAREVDYLIANEWARTASDILYRRTKLGLHISRDGVARLTAYLIGR